MNFTSSLASPVHIVGSSHPQMAQPSKVLNLFPRPSGTESLVLDHMGSLADSKETPRSYPLPSKSGMTPFYPHTNIFNSQFDVLVSEALTVCVSDVSRQMSLPLNGFRQDRELEPLSYSPEQADQLEGPVEDWPDWSDPEESENRDGQSVQIHIQASERHDPVDSRLQPSHPNVEEEPWDDFEDTEPTSDLSPTAPLPDPVVLTPPRGGTATPVQHASESLRLGSSKPLKLTSTLRQSTQSKTTSSWDDGWAQEERDSEKSPSPLTTKPKPTVPQKNGGIGGLGEEFTIKVKKKVEQDPELDLFADMVPDIKLSSPALLPLDESSVSDAGLCAASSENTKSLQGDSSIDTVTLTAKFAAASLTEVSVWWCVWGGGSSFISWDFDWITFIWWKESQLMCFNTVQSLG